MTEMRRITVSFPEEIDRSLIELRKRDEFARCSFSELIRRLVKAGLDSSQKKGDDQTAG